MTALTHVLLALTALTTSLAAVASLLVAYLLLKKRDALYRRQYTEHLARLSEARRLLDEEKARWNKESR